MIDAGAVVLDVIPDTRHFGRRLQGDLTSGSSRGRLTGIGRGMGRALMAGLGAVVAGGAVVKFFGDAVEAASDLSESQSKVEQVFKGSAGEVKSFAETAATSLGQSKQQALEAAGTFGNLFTSLGLSRKAAADMSTETVTLASDLASFNNLAPEEALEKLRSGLVGEIEPLRQLGVSFDAAAVEAKALELGLADSKDEISESAKVQARFALILEQTKNAQGDFARTSGGLANQQRILAAQWTDLKARLGNALLPVITRGATFLNETMLPALERVGDAFGALSGDDGAQAFGEIMDSILGNTGRYVAFFRGIGNIITRTRQAFGALSGDDGAQAFGEILDNLVGNTGRFVGFFRGIGNAINRLRGRFNDAERGPSRLAAVFQQVWPRIREIVVKNVELLQEAAAAAMDFIRGVWARGGRSVWRNVQVVWRNIVKVIKGAVEVVLGVVDVALAALRGDWRAAWEGIKRIVRGGWEVIKGLFGAAWAALRATTRAALSIIQTLWSGAWTRLKNSVSSLWSNVRRTWNDGVRYWQDRTRQAAADLTAKVRDLRDAIVRRVSELWSDVKTAFRNAWSYLVDLVDRRRKAVAGAVRTMKTAIVDTIKSLPERLYNLGKKIFDRFAAGIRAAIDKVKDAIGGVVGAFTGLGEGDGFGIAGPLGGPAGPLRSGAGWQAQWAAVRSSGIPIALTSAYRPGAITSTGNPSWHGKGRAVDLGGSAAAMSAIFEWIRRNYGSITKELIYTPKGYRQVYYGKNHLFSGGTIKQDHYNHVHWALAHGGWIRQAGRFLVGETGPEILNLRRGDMVEPLAAAAGVGLADGDELTLVVEGQPLTAVVRRREADRDHRDRTRAHKRRRR